MRSFENIVGKGENAGNKHFLFFPQCFLPFTITNFTCLVANILLSANPFNLDISKMLSILSVPFFRRTENIIRKGSFLLFSEEKKTLSEKDPFSFSFNVLKNYKMQYYRVKSYKRIQYWTHHVFDKTSLDYSFTTLCCILTN